MSHFISLTEAVDLTSRYRAQKENILATAYQGQGILPICETFDRGEFDTILAKQGCEALRIYYGMDENYKLHAIIVAVNAEDEDMVPDEESLNTEDEDIIEEGRRCPVDCPPESPLNP